VKKMLSELRRFCSDPVLALGVVILAGSFGLIYLFVSISPTWLLEGYKPNPLDLGPAAMLACGEGFTMPSPERVPGLDRFLALQILKLEPHTRVSGVPAQKAHGWYARHRYLLYTLGAAWRLFGIDWHVLKALLVALLCISAALVYGLLRLGVNRWFSILGALAFLASPGVLRHLPNLRDFSKAPFILAALLVMGHLAKRPLHRRGFFTAAGLLGLIVGIGVGFRHDVFICLLAGLFVLLLCPRGESPHPMRERLAAIALMFSVYLLSSGPVRGAYHGSGAPMHDIHMGMSTECEDRLGLERASYERMPLTLDSLVHATANSYARRVKGIDEYLTYDCETQERIRRRMFVDTGLLFPADMMARGYAAVLWVLRGARSTEDPPDSAAARHLVTYGPWYAVLALLLIGFASARTGWIVFFVALYFCGYVALQFQFRHGFHLVVVPIWAIAFVADRLAGAGVALLDRERRTALWSVLRQPGRWWTPTAARGVRFAVGAALVLLAPYAAARAWQHVRLDRLLTRFENGALVPLEFETTPLSTWTLFSPVNRLASLPRNNGWQYQDDYLMAEIAASPEPRCLWVRYESEGGQNDFTHLVRLPPTGPDSGGAVRYFFPVYESQVPSGNKTYNWRGNATMAWSRFAGIALPPDQAGDFKGYYRVAHPEAYRLLLHLAVAEDRTFWLGHQAIPLRGRPGTSWRNDAAIPNDPRATTHEAFAHLRHGDLDRAAALYRDAVARAPKSIEALSGLAATLEAQGRRQAALDLLEQAAKATPDFFLPVYAAGKLHDRNGNLDAAIKAYERAFALNPNATGIQERLALACLRNGEPDRAIEAYRVTLAMEYTTFDLFAGISDAFLDKGDFDEACWALDRALMLDASFVNAAQQKLIRAAERFLSQQEWAAAAAGFRAANERKPTDAGARGRLALALAELGNYEEALEIAREALFIDPKAWPPYQAIDTVYLRQGDAEGRVTEWLEAARIHDAAWRPAFHLGLALEATADHAAAVEAFERALAIAPESAEVWHHIAWAHAGAGDLEAALSAYRRAIDLDASLDPEAVQRLTDLAAQARSEKAPDKAAP